MDTATGEKENQQQVEEYVAKMLPLLQEHGFPHITMTLVDENNKHKILLKGEVASKTKRGLRDSQIVLEAVLKASDPPTKIVNKVRYHVSD